MIRLTFLALLMISLGLGAGCGAEPQDTDELLELSSLDGLDLPADYAGGRYVKVKGTLTRGRSKTGAFIGRDGSYGYTINVAAGESLAVRGATKSGFALTAIYGPQKDDGSWGTLRNKAWTTFPSERGIPTVGYKTTRAGKFLVVLSVGTRNADAPDLPFVLTACPSSGCTAGGCAEWSNDDQGAHWAFNFATVTEAALVASNTRQTHAARAGACGEQAKTCTSTSAPVCVTGSVGGSDGQTFANTCKARVALRTFVSTGLDANGWIATAPGACH